MAAPITHATGELRQSIALQLTACGLTVDDDGARLTVTGAVGGTVRISQQLSDGKAPRLTATVGGGDADVFVAIFVDAAAEPTGSALVVSAELLSDVSRRLDATWHLNVTAKPLDDPGSQPFDACVVPIDEVGDWVRAELAALGDDEDDE